MKYIFLLLLSGFSCFAFAQAHVSTRIDHIAIVVDDLDKSVAFYNNVLGLTETVNETKKPNIRWMLFADGVELHLINVPKDGISLIKNVHLALAVADLAAFQAHLKKLNIPYENWPGEPSASNARPDGVNQVYIQDPDGYWIEVNDAAR